MHTLVSQKHRFLNQTPAKPEQYLQFIPPPDLLGLRNTDCTGKGVEFLIGSEIAKRNHREV